MAFEDVARRMGQQAPSKAALPVVTPANRTVSIIKAWVFLLLGIGIAGAAGVVMILWFNSLSSWQFRGLAAVVGFGVMLVVRSTMLFEAASNVEALPRASVSIRKS